MKIALSLIVKASDSEAVVLERLLENTAEHVDGIFITITGSNYNVEKVAKKYKAHISHFEWVNDFSKARNYNFSQVPKEYDYILWADADDVFRGLEKLRNTIKENPADIYSMNYLYAFDEFKNPIVVHLKSQVIKNDGCVIWEGALHEDFSPTREVRRYLIKGIERLHLSNETRFNEAKERNLTVAKHQLDELPDDPRSYWNIGNSLKALGLNTEAIEAFDKFLELSNSDDEKYIARLRRAESFWALGEKNKAIIEAQYAVGIMPHYPDAYHLLGSLYLEIRQYEKARDSYLMGLIKKPPYHSIIVYNPRDYDFVPMNNLAKVYFALNLPQLALPLLEGCLKICPKDTNLKKVVKIIKKEAEKADEVIKIVAKLQKIKDKEKLKKALEAIPEEYQSHPAVCNLKNVNFIKEKSSGRDLVIFCGYTSEEWTPETAKTKGIGGSEEAVIHLSRGLVKQGWNVTVFNNCGYKELEFDGVKYRPFWSWNYRDKQDVVILWRSPRLCDYDINADQIIIDLHDVVQEGEFTENRLKKISKIFVKSKFHRFLFPNIPDEKFEIIPNGIDAKVFEQDLERDPYLLINTSSPDRGLNVLVDLFAEVKKRVPEARLKWAYGWNVFDVVHGNNPKIMGWKSNLIKKMEDSGVENLGRLGHDQVNKLYMQASIFAYPSEFAEIDCISLSKALAGGAIPVTTDFAAMGDKKKEGGVFIKSEQTKDTWSKPYQFDFSMTDENMKKQWIEEVVMILKGQSKLNRDKIRQMAREKYDWDNIINQWNLCLQ